MEYVIEMRRKIHEYPEIGFDLPITLALVKGELDKFGVTYTEKYGKSSIVAVLNEDKSHYTIGIRADMDALPINEKNDVPYKSKIEGQMHACGHDAHTAILIDTVRRLFEIKDEINCRVLFVFQSAEEFAPGGAKLMVEDGLMDEVDCMLGLHVDPSHDSGKIAVSEGPINAISNGFYLDFYGKSAHVASQQNGVDAIIMATKSLISIELMIAKEISAENSCIFNVGEIKGGKSNNVICDHCSMFCTLRSFEEETDSRITDRIKNIINATASESGGRAEFTGIKYYPYLNNEPGLTKQLRATAASLIGDENIEKIDRDMSAEDFAYYGKYKPSCMFRLGIRNEAKGCIAAIHQDTFMIDEDTLKLGSDIFVEFVKQNSYISK